MPKKGKRRMEVKRKPAAEVEGLERIFPTLPIAMEAISPVASRHSTASHEESLHPMTNDQMLYKINFECMVLFSSNINLSYG